MQINDAVFLTQAIYEKLQPLRSPRIAAIKGVQVDLSKVW